ncbi:FtsX-like permease family protein [Nocardioides sp. MAHUQ-72]|uniref:ABC transporter permease n=1 Tax=unclassified Nocardioides TaxID=2615069 RepID=UPI00360C7802
MIPVRALAALIRPELRGRRLRAMLVLLGVVALAAAAIVAGLSTQQQAGSRWDAAFAQSNGAHVTITSDGPAALRRVAADRRVAARSAAYAVAFGVEVLRGRAVVGETVVLRMSDRSRPDIARPLLRDGRWGSEGAADEAVVDRAFALDEGISLGDRLTLRQGGRSVTVTVVGQAINLRDTFYPDGDATVWLDPAGFDALAPGAGERTVFLRLHDPDAAEAFVSDVSGSVGTSDWRDTRTDVLRAGSVFATFLRALGGFVMVAAAIVVAGSVATRVLARRRDIGLLKAVGATPAQVTAAVVLAHVLVAGVGVLLGWLLGGWLSGKLQLGVAEVLGSAGPVFDPVALLITLVVVEVLVVAATVLPARRAGRIPTTVALAPVPPTRGHRSRLAAFGERLGLGPVVVAGLRDAFAQPARATMTALALGVAVVGVVVTAGFSRTIDSVIGDPAVTGEPEEVRVFPAEGAPRGVVPRALDREAGVRSWFTETGSEATLGEEQFLANAVGGDIEDAGFVVRQGRMIRHRGETVTGYGFLQRFGVEVGDRIAVRVEGHPLTLTIVGWYSETEEAGEMLMYPFADAAALDSGVRPESYRVDLAPGADRAEVAGSLTQALGPAARVEAVPQENADVVDPFLLAVDLISGLVILVALANLAATLALVVRQRARDLAVLRAVGFTPRQAVAVVATDGVVLALLAVAVGLPLGWVLSGAANDAVGAQIGMGPGIAQHPSWTVVVLVAPLAVVVTVGLAVLAARRAATAEVAELVRYE